MGSIPLRKKNPPVEGTVLLKKSENNKAYIALMFFIKYWLNSSFLFDQCFVSRQFWHSYDWKLKCIFQNKLFFCHTSWNLKVLSINYSMRFPDTWRFHPYIVELSMKRFWLVCHRHGGNYDNILRYYRLSHDVVIPDQHHAMRSPDWLQSTTYISMVDFHCWGLLPAI